VPATRLPLGLLGCGGFAGSAEACWLAVGLIIFCSTARSARRFQDCSILYADRWVITSPVSEPWLRYQAVRTLDVALHLAMITTSRALMLAAATVTQW